MEGPGPPLWVVSLWSCRALRSFGLRWRWEKGSKVLRDVSLGGLHVLSEEKNSCFLW